MAYIPDRGDIVETNFDPQVGHEQAGSRPALILSRKLFNAASGLAVCCPITGRRKGYPFEVPLSPGLDVYGVILVDQIKSLDWQERKVKFLTKLSESDMIDVMEKLNTLLT